MADIIEGEQPALARGVDPHFTDATVVHLEVDPEVRRDVEHAADQIGQQRTMTHDHLMLHHRPSGPKVVRKSLLCLCCPGVDGCKINMMRPEIEPWTHHGRDVTLVL